MEAKTTIPIKVATKNWIHSPDTLLNGHVVYLVKFLGDIEVDQPKGIEVVKQGVQKLKFNQQLKKAESGSSNTKMPKAELTISVNGVTIIEPKTKNVLHQYPLHRISYCADDKAEKRFFSFIAKEADSEKHTCFVFVSDKLAEEITLTIGQAFDLAYKRFLSGKTQESDKEKIARLERENAELTQRLKDVANLLEPAKLGDYMKKNNIKELSLVAEREILEPHESEEETRNDNIKPADVSEVSEDSAVDTQDKLINFDDPVNKLDHMTLDDLNDDDFDPRAEEQNSDSSESDDFNPRGSAATTPFTISSPVMKPPVAAVSSTPPAKILPPPSIPARNPSKISGSKIAPVMGNPFTASANDAFGMSSFSTGSIQPTVKDPFAAGAFGAADFSLDQLDPLKK